MKHDALYQFIEAQYAMKLYAKDKMIIAKCIDRLIDPIQLSGQLLKFYDSLPLQETFGTGQAVAAAERVGLSRATVFRLIDKRPDLFEKVAHGKYFRLR